MSTIRPATLADVEAISRIHAATWKEAYCGLLPPDYLAKVSYERWLPTFTKTIENRSHTVAVFEHEYGLGGLGGCVTFGPAREEQMAGVAEITAIYVLPQLWRLGWGRRLMRYALDELERQGYHNGYLWVLKGNLRACDFYQRMGFTFSGEEKCFTHDGQDLQELRYCIKLSTKYDATIGC